VSGLALRGGASSCLPCGWAAKRACRLRVARCGSQRALCWARTAGNGRHQKIRAVHVGAAHGAAPPCQQAVRVCCHCANRHSPASVLQTVRKQPATGPGAEDRSRCARAYARSASGPRARRACARQGVVLVEGAAVAGFCAAWAAQPRWAFALDYAELAGAARGADPELRLPLLPGARPNPTKPQPGRESLRFCQRIEDACCGLRVAGPAEGRTTGAVRANARPSLICVQGCYSLQARRRSPRPARRHPQARRRCPRPARRRPRRAARTARRRPQPPRACMAWPSPGRRMPCSTCAPRPSTGRRWRRCWRPAHAGLGLYHPTPSQARAAGRPRRSRTAPRTSCARWRARARARPAAGALGCVRRSGRFGVPPGIGRLSAGQLRRPSRRTCAHKLVVRCTVYAKRRSCAPCQARPRRAHTVSPCPRSNPINLCCAQAARRGGGRRGGGRARGGLAHGARRVRRRQCVGQPRAGRQGARAPHPRTAA
jgi:hypothetical protein